MNIKADVDVKKLYGKTHTFKRIYSTLSPNLLTLKSNQSVCWGDGKTFCYLLTKKDNPHP